MRKLTVNAEIQNLAKVLEFILADLPESNSGKKLQQDIELICEEIFVNICSYAYGSQTGTAEIETNLTEERLEVIFRDSGKPFNPLKYCSSNFNLPPEERAVGGLGIYMVKKLADTVFYQYTENTNILTITKQLKF